MSDGESRESSVDRNMGETDHLKYPKSGIDEMPKSQIEKRTRNMKSTSQVSRREKRNVDISFLDREENENSCKQNGEVLNIFSSFEMRREIQKYFL